MAINFIKRLSSGTAPYFSLATLLLLLAYLLSIATEDSSRLNDLFLWILGLTVLSLLLLMAILARSLYRLYQDYRNKKEGARLTVRLVSLFVLLLLISTTIIYSFSMHFLHRGINSWFDVKVEQALSDSLELSRSSIGIRMRTLLRQTRLMTGVLNDSPDDELNHNVRELARLSGAIELSLWTLDGELITSSIDDPTLIPSPPNETILRQLRDKDAYIGLDPEQDRLQLRSAVRFPDSEANGQRFLQVIFAVNEQLSTLGKTVQEAYTDYKELVYLRQPLITIFTLTLSLIVLLTLLASIWFAIWISRRIVEPLQALSEGTQAVASGNYNTQLSSFGHDEIGFLVRSFNQMTQRLTHARHATENSHRELEQQTRYLTTVLGSLSSGVITVDNKHILRTANQASSKILQRKLEQFLGSEFSVLSADAPCLDSFVSALEQQFEQQDNWQQHIEIKQKKGLQTLMCRGTLLPNDAGWVIVFDDISSLLQAQRSAAWAGSNPMALDI